MPSPPAADPGLLGGTEGGRRGGCASGLVDILVSTTVCPSSPPSAWGRVLTTPLPGTHCARLWASCRVHRDSEPHLPPASPTAVMSPSSSSQSSRSVRCSWWSQHFPASTRTSDVITQNPLSPAIPQILCTPVSGCPRVHQDPVQPIWALRASDFLTPRT